MKTLIEVFNSVRASMHWGPAMEPFHLAVIEKCDELEARVVTLEAERADDKAMMDMLRAEWNEMFPKYTGTRKYIDDPANEPSPAQTVVNALVGPVADDAASLVEEAPAAPAQNPAEPAQTPVPDLLSAQPEPVPAGLYESQQGTGYPSAANSAAPSEAPASDSAAE